MTEKAKASYCAPVSANSAGTTPNNAVTGTRYIFLPLFDFIDRIFNYTSETKMNI